MSDTSPRLPRRRVVRVLNRLVRIPEPIKQPLRRSFIVLIDIGARLPGTALAAERMRRRLPEPYRWFAEHYEAYRLTLRHPPRQAVWAVIDQRLSTADRAPLPPPNDLGAEERNCFTRLAFAASNRRRRGTW